MISCSRVCIVLAGVMFAIVVSAAISVGRLQPELPQDVRALPRISIDRYPQREIWAPVSNGLANVSHFIFHDRGHTGMFSEGDTPLAGIYVELHRPDGSVTTQRSNVRGFVNFTNSPDAPDTHVQAEGEYRFRLLVPPGWHVTDDVLLEQSRTYSLERESRPGLVINATPHPVGLAHPNIVRGPLFTTPALSTSHLQVLAIGPTGDTLALELDDEQRIKWEARPGEWKIIVKTGDGEPVGIRNLVVRPGVNRMSALRVGAERPVAPLNERTVITFDALTSGAIAKVPNGFSGLQWTNAVVVRADWYGGAGYVNNARSGEYVVYNSSGYPMSIARAEPFDFVGGYLGGAWPEADGEELIVRAWRGSQLIADDTLRLSAFTTQWFDADYRSIDRLELATAHWWQFVADDLEFRF